MIIKLRNVINKLTSLKMINIGAFLFLFITCNCLAQEQVFKIYFRKFKTDTISESARLNFFNEYLETQNPQIKVAESKDGKIYFLKKCKIGWIVYNLPINKNITGVRQNGLFLNYSYTTEGSKKRNKYSNTFLGIIDESRQSFCEINSEYFSETRSNLGKRENETDEQWIAREPMDTISQLFSMSKIQLRGKYLAIKKTFKINTLVFAEPFKADLDTIDLKTILNIHDGYSGLYQFKNGIFVLVKRYKKYLDRLQPVHWVNGLSVGMPVWSLFELYPDVKVKEKSPREYGDDYDGNGYDVYDGTKVSYYFQEINKKIASYKVFSPKIKVGGYNAGMTVQEVLNKYPKLKIKIDEITEYEYVYIPTQNIKLIFLTNNENRVGRYLKDWEKGSVGIKRGLTKVDRIDFD